MTFDIITLFPEMFTGPFDQSILRRAQNKSKVMINLYNLRHWAIDKRGTVDDRPYGGGVGMILRIEPIYNALQNIRKQSAESGRQKAVLLDPRGEIFNQDKAAQYAQLDQLILICGHYEGVDERVRKHLVDETISIGNYVLTGGEIPAMVIVDVVTRLIPGVLEKPEAVEFESFSTTNHLEYAQYTRPEIFKHWKVPGVLLSGDHKKIAQWREKNSV